MMLKLLMHALRYIMINMVYIEELENRNKELEEKVRYLQKQIQDKNYGSEIRNSNRLRMKVEESYKVREKTLINIITILFSAIDKNDFYIDGHQKNTKDLAYLFDKSI